MAIYCIKITDNLQNNCYDNSLNYNYKVIPPKQTKDIVSFKGKINLLPIKFRKATIQDIPVIMNFLSGKSENYWGQGVNFLEKTLKTDTHIVGVDEKGRVVGHLHLHPNYLSPGKLSELTECFYGACHETGILDKIYGFIHEIIHMGTKDSLYSTLLSDFSKSCPELAQKMEKHWEQHPFLTSLSIHPDTVGIARRLLCIGKKDLFLNSISVRPDERGRKVGQQLMLKAFDKAKTLRSKRIELMANVYDQNTLLFFQKFGFRFNPEYFAGNYPYYWMGEDLTNPIVQERVEKIRQELAALRQKNN